MASFRQLQKALIMKVANWQMAAVGLETSSNENVSG
jgi:hypothetical protein